MYVRIKGYSIELWLDTGWQESLGDSYVTSTGSISVPGKAFAKQYSAASDWKRSVEYHLQTNPGNFPWHCLLQDDYWPYQAAVIISLMVKTTNTRSLSKLGVPEWTPPLPPDSATTRRVLVGLRRNRGPTNSRPQSDFQNATAFFQRPFSPHIKAQLSAFEPLFLHCLINVVCPTS